MAYAQTRNKRGKILLPFVVVARSLTLVRARTYGKVVFVFGDFLYPVFLLLSVFLDVAFRMLFEHMRVLCEPGLLQMHSKWIGWLNFRLVEVRIVFFVTLLVLF